MFGENNKGFTLIELLAVIVILVIIMVIITPQVLKIIETAEKESFKNSVKGLMRIINLKHEEYLMEEDNPETLEFYYENGVESSNVEGLSLDYQGKRPEKGIIIITNEKEITLVLHNDKYCVFKKEKEDDITLTTQSFEECQKFIHVDTSGANPPELLTGMTPVKWSKEKGDPTFEEGEWIIPKTINPLKQDWYNYEKKQWANATTKDGSYWVWIPRYAYKIVKGYHSSKSQLIKLGDPDTADGAGIIDIKFLSKDTVNSIDNTPIETTGYKVGVKDTSMHYFLHPAFNFNGNNISGFWVAKFEPSEGQDEKIEILPGKSPFMHKTLKFFFEKTLSMKTFICNSECDTHIMKNIEWGALSYLAHSSYGINKKIGHNDQYKTGGEDYKSNQNQSTTNNIYGVYDMSGGAWEYVMGNREGIATGQDGFNVSTLNAIPNQYINIYNLNNGEIYGDAVYETWFWYDETATFPTSTTSWFLRSGGNNLSSNPGSFFYAGTSAYSSSHYTFRPIAIP